MEPNIELVPTEPRAAVDKYLKHRANEDLSEKTLASHKYRLDHFVRWCDLEGIETMDELSPRDLQDFKHWRKDDGGLNNVSWHTQMTTFRVFLKWAENYEAVPTDLHERIEVPKMDPDEDARDEKFSEDRAHLILDYLEKFEYASQKHTLFALLWHTGMRIGSARAIDLRDFYPGDQYVEIHHRPESDTPLKNGEKGERPIAIAQPEVKLLNEYIENIRPVLLVSTTCTPMLCSKNRKTAAGCMVTTPW